MSWQCTNLLARACVRKSEQPLTVPWGGGEDAAGVPTQPLEFKD